MTADSGTFASETEKRFSFGKNWARFLSVLDEDRIAEAERSLKEMLGCERLDGKTFLDIGSGSGLFSLAARRLGARVHSFDYDPHSVGCTQELRRRYFPEDEAWTVEQGSVLDESYVRALGTFDIVYSWGVLHHTGNLEGALQNAELPVRPGGLFFIALYNDQGWKSTVWTIIKRCYVANIVGRVAVLVTLFPLFFFVNVAWGVMQGGDPTLRFREYRKRRGMSVVHDWVDWFGGYPFEVVRAEDVTRRFEGRGFVVKKCIPTKSLGNHEFVFERAL